VSPNANNDVIAESAARESQEVEFPVVSAIVMDESYLKTYVLQWDSPFLISKKKKKEKNAFLEAYGASLTLTARATPLR
jgi:hypothetical protein